MLYLYLLLFQDILEGHLILIVCLKVHFRGLRSCATDDIIMGSKGDIAAVSLDVFPEEGHLAGDFQLLYCLGEGAARVMCWLSCHWTFIFASLNCLDRSKSISLLNLLNNEYLVLVELLVHGQFACLSECLGASVVGALEGLLPRVDVGVLLQVLPQRELLKADHTNELFRRLMGNKMSSEWESGCEFLITVLECAWERSFHFILWLIFFESQKYDLFYR